MKIRNKKIALAIAIMFSIQVLFAGVSSAGKYYPDLQTKNAAAGSDVYPVTIINDFNTPEDVALWQKGLNTNDITFAASILNGPNQPYEGAGCLEQIPAPVKAYEWRTIYRDFPTPLDLSSANFLTMAADSWGWLGEGFFIKATLYSSSDSYEAIGQIYPDKWNVLYFDISKWSNRNAITKIEISFADNFDLAGVAPGQPGYEYWDGRFQLDYIAATQAADLSFGFDGCTEGFSAQGGSIAVQGGVLSYNIVSDISYIESGILNVDSSKRNTLSLLMKNTTNSPKLKISWITDQDAVWDDIKSKEFSINNSDTFSEYTFELGDSQKWTGKITKLRITPESAGIGSSMEIDQIKFGYKQVVHTDYKGQVNSCLIGDDKAAIGISGVINQEYIAANPGSKVQIFELAPYEDENSIDLSGRAFVEEKDADSLPAGNFIFNIPLMRDVQHSRIYSKFTAVLKNASGVYSLVDSGKYTTNPEILSNNNYPFTQTESIKGLQVQMVADAEQLGVQHAALNIPYNSLLYRSGNHPENTIVYNFEGEDFYLKKDYIQSLDNRVKSLSDNKVEVAAILIMYKTDLTLDTPNEFIVHPDSDNSGTVYAFNTKNDIGIKYYKAITNFLAERYTREDQQYGRIMNYIVGNEIGQNRVWNNMGPKLLADYVKDYERTLRLTNTIVKSNCKEARVNISLDHFWYANTSPDSLWSYDNKAIVDTLNGYVKAGGNFGWNIAFHPYPENLFDPRFWEDTTATDSFLTYRITFKNLDVLVRYMQQPEFLYNGQQRHIILSEQGFHTAGTPDGQLVQAAAYAYAYYRVKFLPGIDSFILHRHVDHSQEGGLNLGLWTNAPGEICSPGEKKVIYDVFKYIDTERSLEVTDFAKNIIGITSWESVIPGFDPAKLEKRPVPVEGIAGTVPSLTSANQETISGFEGTAGTDGWAPAENVLSVGVDSADKLSGSNSIKGTVLAGEKKDYKGIAKSFTVPLDFTSKPYLTAGIKLTGMDADVSEGFVMIRAYSGNEVLEGVAKVKPDTWNIIGLDLSNWSRKNSVDKIKIWAQPGKPSLWATGAIYVDDVSRADYATLKNTDVTLVKGDTVSVGDTVTVKIKNNGNEVLNGTVNIVGLNGIAVDKTQEAVNLANGQEAAIAVKITAMDIQPMTRGQLKVTVDGQEYIFNLTDAYVPEVVYTGNMAVLGDFEDGSTDKWIAGQDTASVGSVQRDTKSGTGQYPSTAYHGSYMLEAVKGGVVATTPSKVVKEFSAPVDLTQYASLNYDIFGWAGTSTRYYTTVTLTAANGEAFKYEDEAAANGWKTVIADISQWAARDQVQKIEIDYRGSDTVYYGGPWGGCFYIDFVRAVKPYETEPPTVPSKLRAEEKGATSIKLEWVKSEDNVGVAFYEIYRDGIKIGTTSKTSYTDTGLEPGIKYTYYVKALDAAGNVSGPSTGITVKTHKHDNGDTNGNED